MREAQEREAAEGLTTPISKKHEHVPVHEKLDPLLARLTPQDRVVGWQYRFVKIIRYSSKFKFFFVLF